MKLFFWTKGHAPVQYVIPNNRAAQHDTISVTWYISCPWTPSYLLSLNQSLNYKKKIKKRHYDPQTKDSGWKWELAESYYNPGSSRIDGAGSWRSLGMHRGNAVTLKKLINIMEPFSDNAWHEGIGMKASILHVLTDDWALEHTDLQLRCWKVNY